MTTHQSQRRRQPDDVRRAWWSLALFAPSFVAAFVTGEGLLAALGHSGDPAVPPAIALAAGLPAMAVFALPTLVVGHFARVAVRHGHPEGRTPLVVAALGSGCFVAINLLQLLIGLFV